MVLWVGSEETTLSLMKTGNHDQNYSMHIFLNESKLQIPHDNCRYSFNWAALLLPIFIVWGLTGNLLVCIAIYTDRRLQNVTNYFLFSLAIADLLVCCLVMPMSIMVEMRNGHWHEGLELCVVYVTSDVFLCSASIVHMSVISLDRYRGISQPLKQRNNSKLIVVFKILFVWVTTSLISSPLIVLAFTNPFNIYQGYHCEIFNHYFKIYGSTLTFLIPLIIMIVTYIKTTKLLKQQAQLLSQNATTCQGGLRRATNRSRSRSRKSKLSTVSTTSQMRKRTISKPRSVPDCCSTESPAAIFKQLSRNLSTPNGSMAPRPHRDRGQGYMSMALLREESSGTEESSKLLEQLRNKFKQRTVTLFNLGKRPSTVQDVATEQKATRVLGVVFATFFICWTPFFTLNFTLAFCGTQCQVPPQISSTFLWLGYISSTINPVIYTIFNKRFRDAFSRLLKCKCGVKTGQNFYSYRASVMSHHVSNGVLPNVHTEPCGTRKQSCRFLQPALSEEVESSPMVAVRKLTNPVPFSLYETREIQLSADVTEIQTTC